MKTKKKVTDLLTDGQAVECMRTYAENTSRLKKLESQIELQVQSVRDKYKSDIDNAQKAAKEAADQLIYYAEFNGKRLFKDGRTVDLHHGTISLRLGTPKVDKLRSLTWEAAIEKLRKIFPDFIRNKEEVDKEAIIEARTNTKVMDKLQALGISVIQTETITVKSKEEELVET